MSAAQARKMPGSRTLEVKDFSMHPRHVPLIALLVGIVCYGAVVSALDLIMTKEETARPALSVVQDMASEPETTRTASDRTEATESLSKP